MATGFRALRSILTLFAAFAVSIAHAGPRARDLGVPFEGRPGPLNAITDVAGVTVGQVTLIEDLADGRKVRTGVTAILPRGRATITTPAFAGSFVLNGAGEMTGRAWIEESGLLEGPVMLTNTHSVGTVHEATIAWRVKHGDPDASGYWWSTPVVAETWDGELNDVNGFHVKAAHVDAALDGAKGGPVDEGNVGGGTGMTCHGFKCGIGTASRRVDVEGPRATRSACWCRRTTARARRCASPACRSASTCARRRRRTRPSADGDNGSIIIVVATDAPLLPNQLDRIAKRAGMGLARHGLLRRQRLRRHLRRLLDGEREVHGRRGDARRGIPRQRPPRHPVRGDRAGDRGGDRQRDGRRARHGRATAAAARRRCRTTRSSSC